MKVYRLLFVLRKKPTALPFQRLKQELLPRHLCYIAQRQEEQIMALALCSKTTLISRKLQMNTHKQATVQKDFCSLGGGGSVYHALWNKLKETAYPS
jgi:hypothetical protein